VSTSPDTDEALFLAYASGNERAFRTLYERHKGWLYRVVLRQAAHPGLADEIFQETWLTLVRTAKSYEPRAKFTTWLYQIARQRLVDAWRATKPDSSEDPFHAGSATHDHEPHDPLDDVADLRQLPDDVLERKRFIDALFAQLAGLPADQREAFLLWAEAGLTAEEIGAATGVGMEAAKSRLRYARNRLKDALARFAPKDAA
jgi:RNA polymerase sigma-70 factor (ECF subfamily)